MFCACLGTWVGAAYNASEECNPLFPRTIAMKRAFVLLALSASAAAPAFADLALATSKNCMSCHAVDRKVLGPSFKDIATKYKDDKGAVDTLATKIMKGGSGVWGPVPMPANAQVNEAEAKQLVQWIMTLQ
jgi:cytochrome c